MAYLANSISLGPVIGLVTDTTSRVLIEFEYPGMVTCKAVPVRSRSVASPHVASCSRQCQARRPMIFTFSGLQPATKYSISVLGSGLWCPDIGSFWSIPYGGYDLESDRPTFVVKSCDCYYNTRDNIPRKSDLWCDLSERIEQDEIDYIIHLGDNVYNDTDYCDMETGKKESGGTVTADEDCKWNIARKLIIDLPAQDWPMFRRQIFEIFREVYHETWNHPPAKYCLANCPNLMILDDHEVRDDWGDRPQDKDRTTIDWFLASLAYFVICEYQLQLYMDPHLDEHNWGPHCWPQQDYYFVPLGDVGIYMQDIRACKTFHWDAAQDASLPMMGARQWAALDSALSPGGKFNNVRLMIVAGPEPFAYASKLNTRLGARVVDDMYGHWMAKKHVPEATRFLRAVFDWRHAAPEGRREVLLLGGDVHEGGWTQIKHCSYYDKHNPEEESWYAMETMQQLTTSAMSYHVRTNVERIVSAGTKNLGRNESDGFHFRHYSWTPLCNYGIIEAYVSEDDDSVTYEGKLVAGGPNGCYERSKFSPDYAPTKWQACVEEGLEICVVA